MVLFVSVIVDAQQLNVINIEFQYDEHIFIPSSDYNNTHSMCEVTMPKVESQDGFPFCAAFTHSALLDNFICRREGIKDCTKLDPRRSCSPLDLARYHSKPYDWDYVGTPGYKAPAFDQYKLSGATIGDGYNNLLLNGRCSTRACIPWSKVMQKYKTQAEKETFIEKLKEAFNEYHKNLERIRRNQSHCSSCELREAEKALKSIHSAGLKNLNIDDIQFALAKDRIEKFLVEVMSPKKCEQQKLLTVPPNYDAYYFPTNASEQNMESVKRKLNDLVCKQKLAVGFTFCAEVGKVRNVNECDAKHTVAIAGLKRVCTEPNGKGECLDLLKVHNSWGEEWQESTNGGWVVADELIKRTFYEGDALSWLEERP